VEGSGGFWGGWRESVGVAGAGSGEVNRPGWRGGEGAQDHRILRQAAVDRCSRRLSWVAYRPVGLHEAGTLRAARCPGILGLPRLR